MNVGVDNRSARRRQESLGFERSASCRQKPAPRAEAPKVPTHSRRVKARLALRFVAEPLLTWESCGFLICVSSSSKPECNIEPGVPLRCRSGLRPCLFQISVGTIPRQRKNDYIKTIAILSMIYHK
jgi:hypothetical protein